MARSDIEIEIERYKQRKIEREREKESSLRGKRGVSLDKTSRSDVATHNVGGDDGGRLRVPSRDLVPPPRELHLRAEILETDDRVRDQGEYR